MQLRLKILREDTYNKDSGAITRGESVKKTVFTQTLTVILFQRFIIVATGLLL